MKAETLIQPRAAATAEQSELLGILSFAAFGLVASLVLALLWSRD